MLSRKLAVVSIDTSVSKRPVIQKLKDVDIVLPPDMVCEHSPLPESLFHTRIMENEIIIYGDIGPSPWLIRPHRFFLGSLPLTALYSAKPVSIRINPYNVKGIPPRSVSDILITVAATLDL